MQRSRLRKLKKLGPETRRSTGADTAAARADRGRHHGGGAAAVCRRCAGREPGGTRGSRGHRAEAHREPAGRTGEHHRDRYRKARTAQRAELQRLREVPAERRPTRAPARASPAYSCAASPAATTATIQVPCPAWACTWTSSRSPPSRARSTSTCTTSSASKRSPDPRARCTVRVPKPAPYASSPTSRTFPASRPVTPSRATPCVVRRGTLPRAL